MAGKLVELMIMAVLATFSAACLTLGLKSLGGELRVIRRVDGLSSPSPAGRLIESLGEGLGRILILDAADRREIEQNLQIAGYDHPSALFAFAWIRVALTLAAWLASAAILGATGHWTGVGPYLPWGVAGMVFLLSKRVLGWSVARRRRKVEAELPFFIDVLTMMLESGVSLDQGFRTFAQVDGRGAPLIRRSLEALMADIERGMPYETALDRWAERLGVSGARDLAGLFKRNLAHGAELGGALAAFAREMTEKRVGSAREAVGRKSAQMAIAMMLFFLPALFIVLAGPAFVTLTQTLRGLTR